MGSRLAVAGATGAVGRTMLSVLEERDFPVSELRLLASARSAGSKISTRCPISNFIRYGCLEGVNS